MAETITHGTIIEVAEDNLLDCDYSTRESDCISV